MEVQSPKSKVQSPASLERGPGLEGVGQRGDAAGRASKAACQESGGPHTSRATPQAARLPLLVVISAPSGAGKTTLCEALLASDPGLARAVTCTTRPPRPGERDGRDYHFLDAAAFQRRVEAGEFLEHATVHSHRYGPLKSEVLGRLRRGQDVLLNIDVQGAASVRACAAEMPEIERALCSIFIVPPSMAELEARLRHRGQDAEEVVRRRLSVARAEMAHWKDFDYLVVNDTVPLAARRMQAIIEAERLRQFRVAPPEL